jgi:HAE1 family hydrophobic/amphiphilic exporter-1
VLIVFLFLNSWRSTVITGLTLPIALIGTFFFMHFGFTINMITLMALSLCVGLLIDDAIVVRENIVRHVQMGKTPSGRLDGTQEIGLAVLATTLSIVAVFLPIGFMGGIIGKFFHEFGITIVAAVLISMFVSFTLDPMLSSVWHDPASTRPAGAGKSLYDRTLGRVTHGFERATEGWPFYQRILAGRWRTSCSRCCWRWAFSSAASCWCRCWAPSSCPRPTFRKPRSTSHPQGSSLEATEAKARQVESHPRLPEVRYTLTTINTGNAQARPTPASTCAWWTASSAAAMWTRFAALRERCSDAGHHRHPCGPAGPGGRAKADRVLAHGPDLTSWTA